MAGKKTQSPASDARSKTTARTIRAPLIQAGTRRSPGDVVDLSDEEAAVLERQGFLEPMRNDKDEEIST